MLTPEQIDALRDAAEEITQPITDYLIREVARRISEAGQLTSTASYEIWKLQNLGVSQREIKKQLQTILKVSHRRLRQLLTQSAEVGYRYDLSRLPYVQAQPFERNEPLQQMVAAAVQLAQDDLTNMVQTLGFIAPDGNEYALTQAYQKACDFAFTQTFTGAADYNTAIRRATKNLANMGIQVVGYESGVHTSLEAAVRRNVMSGIGLMQEQISQQNHDDLGCDGWEISAHAASAPDHEPIQGKQYSDEAYQRLNSSLKRRIGTLNCGHAAFPIILGVSIPQYTAEELKQFREDNEKGVTYEGKHYTTYEATQMQRQIERSIRRQKKRILVDESVGNKEKLLSDQIYLRRLNEEYVRFSKGTGLRMQQERAQATGFGIKQMAEARKTIEKYSAVRYNKDGTIVVTDDWTQKEHPNLPKKYFPNAVIDTISQNGRQRDRMIYDEEGRQKVQISNGPHGNMKQHPFGTHGEHAHDIVWKDGKINDRPRRELSDQERKENGDIL